MTEAATIPTPATPDVCTMAILVGGQPIPDNFHVLSVIVQRELNRIPSAQIQIDDGEAAKATFPASNSAAFAPGKAIEIQFGYRAQNATVFKGRIVRQRLKLRKGGGALSVDCSSEALLASITRKSRTFTETKDSDIMESVLGGHNLAHDVEATTPTVQDVVQYDSTDWDFVLCRAEANGQVVAVGDDKIAIARPKFTAAPVLQLTYGSTVLEFDAEMDARPQGKGLKAVSWKAADQTPLSIDAAEPAPPQAGNVAAADLAKAVGDEEEEVLHCGALDAPQLQAWADARLMRMRLARLRGRARCQGFSGVHPGDVIEIAGVGERFSGKLYVSGVRHNMAGGNWETDVQFGLEPEIFAETFRLRAVPAAGLLPPVGGLQIGVVTQLEGDPAGEERVKCRLPLVSAGGDGVWARLATLDAGKQRGAFFRPEIGDEVIVGFLGEDPSRAVILGQCHSSAHPAPSPAADKNDLKGYVSREKLKFSFDDGKKALTLETPGGARILLSDDGKQVVLQDQNGNKITLDQNGIAIESAKNLVIKSAQDAKLSGLNAEISAQSAFKASGSATAEVSGAQTKINGDAMTVIKGGLVQIN